MATGNSRFAARNAAGGRGFSLIELLVAMAVFLIVAGAAFSLFNKHVAIATSQENLSGVNIGLRNAVSQLQMDLAGAGTNLLATSPGAPVAFSLGVIVQNNVPGKSAACTPNAASWAYPTDSACFDSLTVTNPKPKAPLLVIADPGNREGLDTSSIIFAADPNGGDLAADASFFKNGDEILVVNPNNTNNTGPGGAPTCGSVAISYYCMTIVSLTKDAEVAGGKIQLQHNPTGAGGLAQDCPGISCTDPLGVIFSPTHSGTGDTSYTNALGAGFQNGAFIVDLGTGGQSVTYAVQADPANPVDTQLVRCGGAACVPGNTQVLMDQVVGFKVGAGLSNNQTSADDIASFFYDASQYCNGAINNYDCNNLPAPAANIDPYDFTLIHSLRISMIARTAPNSDLSLRDFRNGFDGGPYLVQQAAVVVDLRNVSINEFGN